MTTHRRTFLVAMIGSITGGLAALKATLLAPATPAAPEAPALRTDRDAEVERIARALGASPKLVAADLQSMTYVRCRRGGWEQQPWRPGQGRKDG